MRRALLAGLVLASGQAVAAPIIGGTPATTTDFPAVALVQAGGALCTGELIDPEWVMTAAHCLDPAVLGLASQDAVTTMTAVLLGTVDVTHRQGSKTIGAQATFIDPMWNKAHFGKHDLGLIHLSGAYTLTPPMRVNFIASLAPVGIDVTMVGFGTTSGSANATAGVEYELTGQVSETCDDFHVGSGATLDDRDLLCFTQAHAMGTCEGDSGGPLVATIDGVQMIVGTTSFGDQACAVYGAYTRTDAEIDFVKAHLPALCDDNACVDPNPPDTGGCCDARGQGGATAMFGAALVLLCGVVRGRRRRACTCTCTWHVHVDVHGD